MINNLNEQKAKLKERVNKDIDVYFAALESGSAEPGFDINKLEQLMLENHGSLKKTLNEANSEIASNMDVPVKKNAQNAEVS